MNFEQLINFLIEKGFDYETANNSHLQGTEETYHFLILGSKRLFAIRKNQRTGHAGFCIYRDKDNNRIKENNIKTILSAMNLLSLGDFEKASNKRDMRTKSPVVSANYPLLAENLTSYYFGSIKVPPESILIKPEKSMIVNINVIKYGPPGTGKTYSLVKDVLDITKYDLPTESNIHEIIRHGANNNNFKQVEFITFHQSYSYEEFVEGIRAEVVNGQVTYKIHNGIFKRLCRRAYFYKVMSLVGEDDKQYFTDEALSIYENKTSNELNKNLLNILTEHATKETPEDSKKHIPKFVLCIDEINRANISRVFGELITLIEDTKRQGAKETISVTLPYSGDEFFVPDNLYIRGTMNTADRSLAKLDLALRRRFHFEAYYPDLEQVKNATARNILDQLNSFITRELDREHTIGHSYLMTIDGDATGDTLNKALAEAFKGKIIPLLEEYFLHEPTKVNEAITAAGIANDVVNI